MKVKPYSELGVNEKDETQCNQNSFWKTLGKRSREGTPATNEPGIFINLPLRCSNNSGSMFL